jgi:hypothetical protein
MPTVQSLIDSLPYHLQKRYGSSQMYRWVNEGLRKMQQKNIDVSIRMEAGVEVSDDVYIPKPSGVTRFVEIYHPEDRNLNFPFEEIGSYLRLINRTFDKEDSPITVSTFSGLTTTSVTINVTGLVEGELEGALLIIDTGTYAGRTYRISGNDVSGATTTKVYLLLTLSSALTALQVITGHIVDKYHYLMMVYDGVYTTVSGLTDEIAMDDEYEDILIAWMNWKCQERTQAVSDDTAYWKNRFKEEIVDVDESRLKVGRKQTQIGRNLPGMRQNSTSRYTYTHSSD